MEEVSFDTSFTNGFKNLSEKWNESITTSFESPKEIQHPQALADIMIKAEEDLKETSQEKLVLSSEEFEKKIARVKFIEGHPTKNFIFRDELGHGGVCKVFKTEARFANNTYYAVRIMKILDPDMLQKIRCEIAVMELCSNSYIVQYHFTYYYRESLFMFIEYMDGGCLTKFIHYHLKAIPENVMAYILRRILKGLASLHQRKQIHRDLKSDNILLNHRGEIKIADFGYALQLTTEKLNAMGPAGTAAWMAPELIMKVEYDEMADIWSLGMIVL
jgi:serine/threonine protein kinase